jgi:UTP:GlnB (protein PII) uridylyltransferase
MALHGYMLPFMDQAQLIAQITDRLRGDPDLRALFLAGSLGRGEGDRFSDVDLVAVVEPEAQDGFAARWRVLLDGVAPVVFWWSSRGIRTLVSAVTEG